MIRNKFKYIIIFCCALFLYSCFFKTEKNDKLKESVFKINKMFESKNWAGIYSLLIRATQNGIGNEDGSLRDFKNRNDEVYLFTTSKILPTTFLIKNDTATVTQEIIGTTYFKPTKEIKNTVFDFWVYKKGNWFLLDYHKNNSIIRYLTREDSLQFIEDEINSKKLIDSILKKIDK
ncbi:MAG: hypothetical protein IPH97_11150 [Ignavibacteriales bacterium]|nr:hypothetical protein [Ignavibacteriales bacterium]